MSAAKLSEASGPKSFKRAFVVFVVIVAVLLAQIAWWIYYQINQNAVLYQLHQSVLSIHCQQAVDQINRNYEAQLIHFTEAQRHHPPTQSGSGVGLPPSLIPDTLRSEQYSTFYCDDQTIYYKDPSGVVISSSIDWAILREWSYAKYPELVVERLPQTRREPYRYGPARVLRLPILVRPKTEFLRDLTSRTDRKGLMFISEGSFFTLMVLFGVYLMYAALRKELSLQAQQKNFILSVTHELKSPLASIKLYLQTLMRKEVPPRKQGQFLQHSLEDVERLERLVENVLEAGRLDRGEYDLEFTAVDVSDVLTQCVGRVRRSAERDAVHLETSVEPGLIILGDRHTMISVFDNLMDNAIKYSDPPRRIVLNARRQKDRIIVSIRDYGRGIEAADMPHIFDRFYRSGSEMTRQAKGTGIGLYLAKKIVEIHQGIIEVQSEGRSQGSLFVVTLPSHNRTGPATET